ncbi:telomere repeat-binding protein 2-like isoform X4 [Rhododendron vialii]|uniref:telomere repeat-binding protein 2-like isoform X4 n=1 Tax=Rhododendron vialii TaxID=182163 RepID=UPI002660462A|nr:telomere repeat-binding protein 2-like isoform X4 [Rhododendron vialii]
MVLKKRLEYGFSGYSVPVIPRGPRSKRGSHKKTLEDGRICAFELLAAVAGKLLQESESSTSSNVAEGLHPSSIHNGGIKQEQLEKGEALKSERRDQGSWVESVFSSELAPRKRNLESSFGEFPRAVSDTVLEGTSVIPRSKISTKVRHDLKLKIPKNKTAAENSPGKVEGGSPNCGDIGRQIKAEGNPNHNVDLTVAINSNSKDPMEIHVNITDSLINSDTSVQLPSYRDSIPNASFPRHKNNVKLRSRVDDENPVGCNVYRSKTRAIRPQTCIGHRRVRKLLASKYWKVAPTLEDCEFSGSDGCKKNVNRCRKAPSTSEVIQCLVPLKKRKLCNHNSTLAHDPEGSSESISNSPEKGVKGEKSSPAKNLGRAKVVSSSVVGHQTSLKSRDSHVKFSIKSFKVPELYIDIPENATVGSLKGTVMEAVTAILQGGLRVGVVVHGKKVKDDNKTLLQMGISHNDDLGTLSFTLEAGSRIASQPPNRKEVPILLPCETHHQFSRSAAMESEVLNASFDPSPATNVDNHVETNHELVPSTHEVIKDGTAPDSRALVAIPAVSVEALAVVPVNQKTRRCELVQRRTRRPFSVSEVEALVEAVEKLGTGRWRDVKLSAFENADHRTYVDLKDKWKTLVHTATISPHQRRGETVPQDLLDRVLSAHGYWSHHQHKLHGKHLINLL